MKTHGVGMGTVHPIVEERLLRLASRRSFVAASEDIHRSRWMELVAKVAVHFGLFGELVAHDEHLATKPVHSMDVNATRTGGSEKKTVSKKRKRLRMIKRSQNQLH